MVRLTTDSAIVLLKAVINQSLRDYTHNFKTGPDSQEAIVQDWKNNDIFHVGGMTGDEIADIMIQRAKSGDFDTVTIEGGSVSGYKKTV